MTFVIHEWTYTKTEGIFMSGKSRFFVWTGLCVILCSFLFIGPTTLMACGEHFFYDSDQNQWYMWDCVERKLVPVSHSEVIYWLPAIVVTGEREYDSNNSGWIYVDEDIYDYLTQLRYDWWWWNHTYRRWDPRGTPSINLTIQNPEQFISTDQKTVSANTAYIDPASIQWSTQTLSRSGSGTASVNPGTGGSTKISFNPDSAPNCRDYALSYKVTSSSGGTSSSVNLTQDAVSVLRQQYVDRNIRVLARTTRWIRGSSIALQSELTRDFAKLQAAYTAWVHETNSGAATTLRINSSTRTPRQNAQTSGSARTSLHQYGYAYDLSPIPVGGGDKKTNAEDDREWIERYWETTLSHRLPDGEAHIFGNNAVHISAKSYEGGITVLLP